MDYYDQPPSPPKDASNANGKQQATFLTKLYALLERPENHHMIRWDADGEHIIVERPEQLALHVLPSIYRQSRFASFSRQLNIYGFMRKVNLRNVDPGINDPDASTWSHPTLNKHSPPEVVAAFKRRVPPRPAKPTRAGKRADDGMQPRSAIAANETLPFHHPVSPKTRARGFSAPQPYNPPPPQAWSASQQAYARAPLPPLTVPSDPHPLYNPSPLDEVTPQASSYYGQPVGYSNGYGGYAQAQDTSSYSSSLNSILNHGGHSTSGYHQQRPQININTAYASVPMQPHSASSMSPDSHSRPQTGYSSLAPYPEESAYGHHQRAHTPTGSSRPGSSRGAYASVRRDRRHSQTPYPPPSYEGADDRARGPITLPTAGVDYYSQSHDSFAYGGQNDWDASAPRHLRPSTSTSSLSTGSSAAHTPPNDIGGYADAADIHTRYEPEPFGYAVPDVRGYADPVKM